MKDLATESFTPTSEKNKSSPKAYKIRPLNSIQLTEVCSDGAKSVDGDMALNFNGVMLCLRYGLEDASAVNEMPSTHHVEVSREIFKKSLLLEHERKNS
jgi:hypothetical protein